MQFGSDHSCTTRSAVRVAAAIVGLGLASAAGAADVIRAASGALNLPASWNGGAGPVPGPADVAVWDTGSATANTLGADLSFGGIRIAAGEAAAVTISGANVLTLGASGIDMSAAAVNLTIQPTPSTTTGISLGAAQTWNVASGRLLQVANGSGAITGGAAATITKTGLGTTYFNSVLDSFAGGVIVSGGAVTFNTNTVTSGTTGGGGTVTNGPLGTGTITLNGGTISPSTTSGRDLSNDISVTADSTIGLAGNARFRSAGTWDLGSQTRTMTLTNLGTGYNNSTEQFGFVLQGGKTFTLANGNLRFVTNNASASAATPATINFATSGGAIFNNGSGLTIGANVLALLGSTQANANAPALTVESGGAFVLSNGPQTKNLTVSSLSGVGTVGAGQTDGTAAVATFTINGATGSATFGGVIQDVYNTAFGTAFTGSSINLAKTGANTQIFTGANTYTGSTSVSAGTLQLGDGTSGHDGTLATSGVAVSSGATLAFNRFGTTNTAGYVISGAGGVSKTGVGTQSLTGANTYTGATTITAGTLRVANATAISNVLSATGGGVTLGTAGGRLLLDYTGGTSPAATVAGLLAPRYNATSPGSSANFTTGTVRSSAALPGGRTIGYGDTGTGAASTIPGYAVNTVVVRVTLEGDTDLDGDVDFNDFLTLQNFYNQTGTRFDQGNFNYDNVTDFNDFLALQNNYGQSIGFDGAAPKAVLVTAEQIAALDAFAAANAPVPEPASLAALGLGAAGLLRRRRAR